MGGVKAATASFGLSFSGLGGAVVEKKFLKVQSRVLSSSRKTSGENDDGW